jgi:short-subunit dehydrogenase
VLPDGARILLTGASGGLGSAIARELARRGATLVLSGRRESALWELATELPGEHEAVALDLGAPAAAQDLARSAGHVDCLIAAAAVHGTGQVEEYSSEGLRQVLRVNLESHVVLTRLLLPRMRERSIRWRRRTSPPRPACAGLRSRSGRTSTGLGWECR